MANELLPERGLGCPDFVQQDFLGVSLDVVLTIEETKMQLNVIMKLLPTPNYPPPRSKHRECLRAKGWRNRNFFDPWRFVDQGRG